jgi:hypothetical protein
MITRIGTPYFESLNSAYNYYRTQLYNAEAVREKIAAGEIHIGRPPLKKDETLVLNVEEGRYFIRVNT